MKEFNRNWDYITSNKLNVGDLVWWKFGHHYHHSTDKGWKLCIITDVNLDKSDQKTRADWWDYTHPSGHYNNNECLMTDYVENTNRDNCKFNSITMMCPQNSKKLVVLVHPTYKEKWRTENLENSFMTQAEKEKRDALKAHNELVDEKKEELLSYWRDLHKDVFDDKAFQAAKAEHDARRHYRTYYVFNWVKKEWDDFMEKTYKSDLKAYEATMKEADLKVTSNVELINKLNNLVPERMSFSKLLNGVEIDDDVMKGRIDITYRWSIPKTQQWFENKLTKNFDDCLHQLQDWCNNNCSTSEAQDLLRDGREADYAFTPKWFWNNVLDNNDRQTITREGIENLTDAPHGATYNQQSQWTYELD